MMRSGNCHLKGMLFAFLVASSTCAHAQEVDVQIASIVDEGMNRGKVMEDASELIDDIGPRLTNSEGLDKAIAWARDKFQAYRLANIHTEAFHYGAAWNLDSWSAAMISPRFKMMTSVPVAYSPETESILSAPVVIAPIENEDDFGKWRGKLQGKIVLISDAGVPEPSNNPAFVRHDSESLQSLDYYDLESEGAEVFLRLADYERYVLALSRFLKSEGALAMVRKSSRENGLVVGSGRNIDPDNPLALPFIELSREDYRRLVRMAERGLDPHIELSVRARVDTGDTTAENLFAEIPGRDADAGYVMAGAHLDSWFAADGATDNGAASVVIIEAARILRSLDVEPKRTIRFALWSGEEQGLLGSTAYVETHLAERGIDQNLDALSRMNDWLRRFPINKRSEFDSIKAYFNLDSGAGKVRGVFAGNNIPAVPILQRWLEPVGSLDAANVVMSRRGATDHLAMEALGLPAFNLIQDGLDYDSRTWHSSIDTLDHVPPDDIRQAATVLAVLLWQAANSDDVIPQRPPPRPTSTARAP